MTLALRTNFGSNRKSLFLHRPLLDDRNEISDVRDAPPPKHSQEETYDQWFLRKVQEGLDRASDPAAKWFSHDEALKRCENRRAAILVRVT